MKQVGPPDFRSEGRGIAIAMAAFITVGIVFFFVAQALSERGG